MNEKILITGGSGMVGRAIQPIYKKLDFIDNKNKFYFMSSVDADLRDFYETYDFFQKYKPTYVIHLAANVGGLFKNMKYKVDMLEENLLINLNVLKCCHKLNVKKVVSCLSTCIFPDKVEYPLKEEDLHKGEPHFSNDAYAYAKRILDIQTKAYREQYGYEYISIIPCNIYGEYDNFSLENGHVIPSLIHKCYLAKKQGKKFEIRGTGKPLRQFIYSKDLAYFILWSLFKYEKYDNLILSVGEKEEISIKDIGIEIAKNFDYESEIVFNDNFEDGQYKKTVSNQKLLDEHGEYNFTPISVGIKNVVRWFKNHYTFARK